MVFVILSHLSHETRGCKSHGSHGSHGNVFFHVALRSLSLIVVVVVVVFNNRLSPKGRVKLPFTATVSAGKVLAS